MSAPCQSCAAPAPLTPVTIDNRAELSAILYRIGVYGSFRQSMLDAISEYPALAGLLTRQSDDYSITFIELWAAVLDVLTFYQERYANELFLRTAQQQASLIRLARLLDYRPSPGVAAAASLAFTLDPGAVVNIPVGLQVQSVPAQGQPPQIYETLGTLTADARFNTQRIYTQPASQNPLSTGSPCAPLDRIQGPSFMLALAPNDPVVLFDIGSSPVEEKKVAAITAKDDQVTLGWTVPVIGPWTALTQACKFRRKFRIFGYNAPPAFMQPSALASAPGGIAWTFLQSSYQLNNDGSSTQPLSLDSRYTDLAVGTQLLIVTPASAGATLVTAMQVGQGSATSAVIGGSAGTSGAMNDSVTQIVVSPTLDPSSMGDIRSIVIYELVGNQIPFWAYSYPTPMTTSTVYLPGIFTQVGDSLAINIGRTVHQGAYVPGVTVAPTDINIGRQVILVDAQGAPIAATVAGAAQFDQQNPTAGSFGHLVVPLTVAAGDTLSLHPNSAVMLGNVVPASNGQTVSGEVLGNGDAAQPLQTFTLQKQPLTYVTSSTPGGVSSSLKLFVNQLQWNEVPVLYGQPAGAQVFTSRTTEAGSTLIQGGDANYGATFPTGNANVTATYRFGTGVAGQVGASSLTTLLTRLKGLANVTNPIAATGGADPETLAATRENAPRTVRTFNRAVSLQDFQDLITASGEAAKALATQVWDGYAPAVHITVAGQEGATLDVTDLISTLANSRDPNYRLLLDNYVPVPIVLSATLWVNSAYSPGDVQTAATAAVLAALSFDQVSLGESVHLSQMYAVLQSVPGVTAADITSFGFLDTSTDFLISRGVSVLADGSAAAVQSFLRIFAARPDPANPGQVLPAELPCIQTPSQDVTITAQGSA